MGYFGTHSTKVEDCLILSLKDLRKWGYLKPDNYKSGIITVSRRKTEIARYNIAVSTSKEDSFIQFQYTASRFNEVLKEIDYRIPLVTVPMNIGKGVRYYFLCPNTGKRCLKLYKPPQEYYFLHRSSFPYLIYDKQTHTKKFRALNSGVIGMGMKIRRLEKEFIWDAPKYHRNYYNGEPTKNFKKLLKLRHRLNQYTREDMRAELKKIF
ncbi:MAG: hypothetical protein R3E32_26930 [Chitinophagales bacterium]